MGRGRGRGREDGPGGRQPKGIGRGLDEGGPKGQGGRGRGGPGGKPGGNRGKSFLLSFQNASIACIPIILLLVSIPQIHLLAICAFVVSWMIC